MRHAIKCGNPVQCVWEWDPGRADWVCVSGDPSGWRPTGDPETSTSDVEVLHVGEAEPCELLVTYNEDFVWEDASKDKLREI